MKTYDLSTISGLFGLTNQELQTQLSALRPLLELNGRVARDEEIEMIDEFGLRLLCELNDLICEEVTASEVGRAAHLVVGRE